MKIPAWVGVCPQCGETKIRLGGKKDVAMCAVPECGTAVLLKRDPKSDREFGPSEQA
jgi:hypothetical protein